jgi:hypothetical protein
MSAREALARSVLQMLQHGQSVPTQDVLQLRKWAIDPADAGLPLEEIARRILSQAEKPNTNTADQG